MIKKENGMFIPFCVQFTFVRATMLYMRDEVEKPLNMECDLKIKEEYKFRGK